MTADGLMTARVERLIVFPNHLYGVCEIIMRSSKERSVAKTPRAPVLRLIIWQTNDSNNE